MMMAADALKVLGGGADVDLQDLIHVGPTYNYTGCRIEGSGSGSSGSDPRRGAPEHGSSETPSSSSSVFAIGAATATVAGGLAAYRGRRFFRDGVRAAIDAAVKASRVHRFEGREGWAVSMYVRTIDATFFVRTMAAGPGAAVSVSLGKLKATLAVGSKEIAIDVHASGVSGVEGKDGDYVRVRTSSDTPACPDRVDGVCTKAGWLVVIQRDGKIRAGLCRAVGAETVSLAGGGSVPEGFAFTTDVRRHVSRMEKRGEQR